MHSVGNTSSSMSYEYKLFSVASRDMLFTYDAFFYKFVSSFLIMDKTALFNNAYCNNSILESEEAAPISPVKRKLS